MIKLIDKTQFSFLFGFNPFYFRVSLTGALASSDTTKCKIPGSAMFAVNPLYTGKPLNGYFTNSRPLVKECVPNHNFLISQSKHTLWVLNRTISLRWFLRAPKTYVKTDL